MRWVIAFCGITAGLDGTAAVAQPVPVTVMEEKWDSYLPGTDDALYGERWAALPGANRYEILQPADGDIPGASSPPNCLRIPKAQTLGITRSLLPEIEAVLPGETELLRTGESQLTVILLADLNKGGAATSDIFVEISKGDVHADAASGVEKEVIAFGMTNGFFGPSGSPQVFDGLNWVPAPEVIAGDR